MQPESTEHPGEEFFAAPDFWIPPVVRASEEEIRRRKTLAARARRIRDAIGPIGISTTELIRQGRDGEDVDE